jgi:hypothetical protein
MLIKCLELMRSLKRMSLLNLVLALDFVEALVMELESLLIFGLELE